ncbi:MAG: sulfate transporter [Planctomycetales bacterium]|nr:sulfate transporter [Planctomycetales bacterium]
MTHSKESSNGWSVQDLISGTVVFLVALPLCLGIALASNAPLQAGLLAGIVGGIVVGFMSGSSTSVSGPAAGLAAIVASQINTLGFEAFLLAVLLAGAIQLTFGIMQLGNLAAFVPTSVINGLLAAIGLILILKQIPHLLGHDTDPEGEMSFTQPDKENTFSELMTLFEGEIHLGAVAIGLISIVILVTWSRVNLLKKSLVPAPLIVVLAGVALSRLFLWLGDPWLMESSHLVDVPVVRSVSEASQFVQAPASASWNNPAVYLAAVTIAIVASLETLLNLEAVDKLDPKKRRSPPSRELIAQGAGNMIAGLIGALPITSVIVRSSVNVHSGANSRWSAIVHGFLLLGSVALLPSYLNLIPLSALAAILIVTGVKLASPELFRKMWLGGRYQFLPFLITLLAIVFSDLLVGVLIGLAISALFILNSNLRYPIETVVERHLGGEVKRIVLPNQVSFLNRASVEKALEDTPRGSRLLIDGSNSDYVDPDVLGVLGEFREQSARLRGIEISFSGFREKYGFKDDMRYVQHSTSELQRLLTPEDVLEILREGNSRFVAGERLSRNLRHQVAATSAGQFPFAVVLSCIDSRAPVETILDLGLGDIFSIRVAGNVTSGDVLGSMEFGCKVAGAKLVLVLGHTRCGAVTSTVKLQAAGQDAAEVTGCGHLHHIVEEIEHSALALAESGLEGQELIEAVARRNVLHSVEQILQQSATIRTLAERGQVAVVGAMYDVTTGAVEFYDDIAVGLTPASRKLN